MQDLVAEPHSVVEICKMRSGEGHPTTSERVRAYEDKGENRMQARPELVRKSMLGLQLMARV